MADLRDGGTTTAKGHVGWAWSPRPLNAEMDVRWLVLANGT